MGYKWHNISNVSKPLENIDYYPIMDMYYPIMDEYWDIIGISLGYHWDIIGISLGYHWDIIPYHLDQFCSNTLIKSLVNCYIAIENHHFVAGKIHYFDWAIFNSKLLTSPGWVNLHFPMVFLWFSYGNLHFPEGKLIPKISASASMGLFCAESISPGPSVLMLLTRFSAVRSKSAGVHGQVPWLYMW